MVMEVHNVRTPSCMHKTGDARVTSYDGAYHVVDATTSVAIASMSVGALGGDLTWTADNTVAAVTTGKVRAAAEKEAATAGVVATATAAAMVAAAARAAAVMVAAAAATEVAPERRG